MENINSIFQKSVIQRHLKLVDKEVLDRAFSIFNEVYNTKVIEELKTIKEEEYQTLFLQDIFVKVLGYTLKPYDNHNLVREHKNKTDNKKADGAVIKDGKTIAVIELKSVKTKNFSDAINQAFQYRHNQGCKYVVFSNFQILRLYINSSYEFEEFDLFNLSRERFEVFYLLLNKENLFEDKPYKLKEETKFHEKEVSEKLYNDYKEFKDRIFEDIVSKNTQYDKLVLFKKTQKLLDRFLFVLFAEDSGLIPPNTVSKIIKDWNELKNLNREEPLYNLFKDYFSYLDKGKKVTNWGEITAYNGGLFRPDEILDSLDFKISDELLKIHAARLSSYDFESEVDVNILGHIFEHSLTEIEEITAELQGEKVDKKKSKRKKDGVFYTPKYITKYIVENTVGKLCEEKKIELEINDLIIDENYRKKSGKLSKRGDVLFQKLQNYQKWLLSLKILDPACGSGAFLNATLDFLIAEHKINDDLIKELEQKTNAIPLFDIDKAVLENNIYGVDINEESVEIAKLSLWLRTARPGRPLSDLSGNIKCGNSLIDDPEVAGDKAFDWHKEFPHVFNPQIEEKVYQKMPESKPDYLKLIKNGTKEAQEKAEKSAKLSKEAVEISQKVYEYAEKLEHVNDAQSFYKTNNGGFDVVLGNPPYAGRSSSMNNIEKEYVKQRYSTTEGKFELYQLFIEKCGILVKQNHSYISLITPQTWLSIIQATKLRKQILGNKELTEIVFLGKEIFQDASVDALIFILNIGTSNEYIKFKQSRNLINNNDETKIILYSSLDDSTYIVPINSNSQTIDLITKINIETLSLKEIGLWSDGIKVVGEAKLFALQNIKFNDSFFPVLNGKDIGKYFYKWRGLFTCRDKVQIEKHFAADIRLRDEKMFNRPKILIRKTGSSIVATLDFNNYYYEQSLFSFGVSNKNYVLFYILTILNSQLANFLLYENAFSKKETFPQIRLHWLKDFPIKISTRENQQPFIGKAELMLSLNKELQEKKQYFYDEILSDGKIEKLTKKLKNFNELTFDEFIKEYAKKAKIKISNKSEKAKLAIVWRDYFEEEKQKLNNIQTQINITDKEIDQMVYKLYELTSKEISIIEDSVK